MCLLNLWISACLTLQREYIVADVSTTPILQFQEFHISSPRRVYPLISYNVTVANYNVYISVYVPQVSVPMVLRLYL